jgi:hypothetical protein
MVALGAMLAMLTAVRHHAPTEVATLAGVLVLASLAGRWLARDLRAHPSNFPDASPAQGLRMSAPGSDGTRTPSRWASKGRGRER